MKFFMRIIHMMTRPVSMLGLLYILFEASAVAQSSRISTIAGPPLTADGAPAATQTIGFPTSVIVDAAGGFYVVSPDQSRVYRVGADGVLNIIAGSSNGFSGDGGPAAAAQLSYPNGAAIDAQGGLTSPMRATAAFGRWPT